MSAQSLQLEPHSFPQATACCQLTDEGSLWSPLWAAALGAHLQDWVKPLWREESLISSLIWSMPTFSKTIVFTDTEECRAWNDQQLRFETSLVKGEHPTGGVGSREHYSFQKQEGHGWQEMARWHSLGVYFCHLRLSCTMALHQRCDKTPGLRQFTEETDYLGLWFQRVGIYVGA